MPIYEFDCLDCGGQSELLMLSAVEVPKCEHCGGSRLHKRLSSPSPASGVTANRTPAMNEHGCCGVSPGEAGCAGPGSCCGKVGEAAY